MESLLSPSDWWDMSGKDLWETAWNGRGKQWQMVKMVIKKMNYSVSKKFPPLNSLQLCQILTDSHIITLLQSVWNLLQNPYDIAHLTLGMLLQYLGKLKIKTFADIQSM